MPNPPTLCETKVLRMTKPNGQFLFFFFSKSVVEPREAKKKKKVSQADLSGRGHLLHKAAVGEAGERRGCPAVGHGQCSAAEGNTKN